MAKDVSRIEEFVREELQRNPGASTAELFEKAKKLDRNLAKLSIRQFHARYPLQVKRQLAAQRPRRRRRVRTKTADRAAIRAELLAFARALLSADGAAVVDVVGSIEKYVDRVVAAAGGTTG